jgi:hypothetical protein
VVVMAMVTIMGVDTVAAMGMGAVTDTDLSWLLLHDQSLWHLLFIQVWGVTPATGTELATTLATLLVMVVVTAVVVMGTADTVKALGSRPPALACT